jgi:hypothetical protein
MINSVSYGVLKHTRRGLRCGNDQEVVNFLTETVADPPSSSDGPPEIRGPQVKNRCCNYSQQVFGTER